VSGAALWPSPRPEHQPAAVGLLALDIDGTIADDWPETISDRVQTAVNQAVADPRLEVILATGRSAHSAMRVASDLGISQGWAVCSNGSLTLQLDPALEAGYRIDDTQAFDPKPALEAMLRLLPEAWVAVEEVGVGFWVTEAYPVGELEGCIKVVPLAEIAARPATRVILRCDGRTPEEMERAVAAVKLPWVNYTFGWKGWLDLNPPGVSKATALEALRLRLGVPAGGTVAVGDGTNDIAMLSWASRGVVMSGARPEVVAAGSEVTGAVEDDGAAWVIESVLARLAG